MNEWHKITIIYAINPLLKTESLKCDKTVAILSKQLNFRKFRWIKVKVFFKKVVCIVTFIIEWSKHWLIVVYFRKIVEYFRKFNLLVLSNLILFKILAIFFLWMQDVSRLFMIFVRILQYSTTLSITLVFWCEKKKLRWYIQIHSKMPKTTKI